MKWKTWSLACSIGFIVTATGCGGKKEDSSAAAAPAQAPAAAGTTPTAPPPTKAPPSEAVATNNATPPAFNQGTEDETPAGGPAQGAATKPSRPTFGAAGPGGSPPAQDQGAPAKPNRPSIGSTGGASPPTAPPANSAPAGPSLGSAGGPMGAPPSNPNAPGFAGSNSGSAGPTTVENPFQDPANMLPMQLSLRDRAVNAFKSGNVPRAYALYQSHILSSSSDDLEDALKNIRWDKKRIVPRLGYSFAVGLIVNNTSKQESLKPIGTDLEGLKGSPSSGSGASGGAGRPGFGGAGGGGSRPGLGGFSGGPGGSSSGGSAGIPALPAQELSDAAGKFASKFVEAYKEAHSDGKWSEAFREYELGGTLTAPTSMTGFNPGFAGSPQPPNNAGGPPGFGGPQGGPPAGYGAGGPPAGYAGGGGPPSGYRGGGGGPPAGYGQGGPPAGYSGGPNAGGPPGYGGAGGSGGKPQAGGQGSGSQGGNSGGGSTQDRVEYLAPQDDAGSLLGGAGNGFGSNTAPPPPGQPGRPGFGAPGAPAAPGFGAPGFGAPGFGAPGFGAPNAPNSPSFDPALAKELQLPSDTIPLASGLNYIGKGDSLNELAKRALEQNYDALIVFEVDVSFVRVNSTIKNDCRIRAVDLRAEKDSKEKAISSSSLNNRDVATSKDGDAVVEKAVDVFLKKMMEAYALEDLPNFKAESIAGRRLKDLVNDKTRSKLDLLCEVEMYASRSLIDSTLQLAAFERIAGSDGKDLVNSEPEDRIPILEKILDRQFD
jgi:hypothetical protein